MKKMEKCKSRSTSASTRTPKIERKIVEKNRRNRMKDLFSDLLSLLPDHGSKKAMHLPDQVDEVVAYIENLKINVEKMKQKKEFLPRKRSNSCVTSEIQAPTKSSTPFVEVHDMGPNMDVILVSGLDDLSKFYSILHLLQEDGIEVANANFSVHGNSTIQILHDKVGKSRMGVGATTMSRRLKDLICGSTCSEVGSNIDLWDSEIQSDIWGYEIQEFMEPYFSWNVVRESEYM
ncbi:transcription factor bHLH162-like [Olea europaea var. sylvestris]|uniref:transcription factor bHLH162-like n=1 Tax=Olea europaea var. sylvestris TaxID=158386 RepID=UPI000C1CCC65|nr:transcription factor bHLH162-like [Olea europaea var. sylvestris]